MLHPAKASTDLAEARGIEIDSETGVLSIDQTKLEAKAHTLKVDCELDDIQYPYEITEVTVTVEEKALAFADTTAKQGATIKVATTSAPAEFENLESTTEDFTLSVDEDGTVKLAVEDDIEIGDATVEFTYKAYGKEQDGSFKVTVEDKNKPEENASSKASSNFLGSFKGLSSK